MATKLLENISTLIKESKLGILAKEAQEDACAPFAAALYDVLQEHHINCSLETASYYRFQEKTPEWHHSVVNVNGQRFDSKGYFSEETLRKRLKIHQKVIVRVEYKADKRETVLDDDWHKTFRDECHKKMAKYTKKNPQLLTKGD